METKNITCVVCPNGCNVAVRFEKEEILSAEGNACGRGRVYAIDECLHPKRMLTTTVLAEGYVTPVIPVRTSEPVPKELVPECMRILRGVTARPPFSIGRVVVENILGTGADIILTNE